MLIQFVAKNKSIPEIDTIEQKLLDGIVAVFVNPYCTSGSGQKYLKRINDLRSVDYHILDPKLDKEAWAMWHYLTFGRSFSNDNPFIRNGDFFFCFETKIGFLKPDELAHLVNSLNSLSEDFRKNKIVHQILSMFSNRKKEIIFEIE